MPESKQLPSLGTRLKLAWSVRVLWDPWGSVCDSPRVSVSLPPTLRRVGVSLLVLMPFCSSVNVFVSVFKWSAPFPNQGFYHCWCKTTKGPTRDTMVASEQSCRMWKWTKSLQKLWALGGCVTVPGPGTHPESFLRLFCIFFCTSVVWVGLVYWASMWAF